MAFFCFIASVMGAMLPAREKGPFPQGTELS